MPFYIRKQEAIAPGLRRIADEQIGKALHVLADDAVPVEEKVHSLRIRCKKMRALLRLARPVLGASYKTEDKRFRAAAKCLAGHRDNQVMAKTATALGGADNAVSGADLPVPPEAIERSGRILRECQAAVDDWPLDIEGFDDIAPGFARSYQKCLDAWDRVRNEPSDEAYHVLRRFTKYHWYQVRILERLNKTAIRERRKLLRSLQLALGNAHDMAVLQDVCIRMGGTDTQLLQRAGVQKNDLYAEAVMLCNAVYAQSADELVADYSRWWAARARRGSMDMRSNRHD